MTESTVSQGFKNNRVGPIFRGGEVANAAQEAIEMDNPGKEIHIEDRGAYVRIECDHECILTRKSLEEALGRPFKMRDIEINLSSFSGQISQTEDQLRFFNNKTL